MEDSIGAGFVQFDEFCDHLLQLRVLLLQRGELIAGAQSSLSLELFDDEPLLLHFEVELSNLLLVIESLLVQRLVHVLESIAIRRELLVSLFQLVKLRLTLLKRIILSGQEFMSN